MSLPDGTRTLWLTDEELAIVDKLASQENETREEAIIRLFTFKKVLEGFGEWPPKRETFWDAHGKT